MQRLHVRVHKQIRGGDPRSQSFVSKGPQTVSTTYSIPYSPLGHEFVSEEASPIWYIIGDFRDES